MPIQQNLSAGDELVQEIEIPDVPGQDGTSELATLQIKERVMQEFSLVALIPWGSTQAQGKSGKHTGCSPRVILRDL